MVLGVLSVVLLCFRIVLRRLVCRYGSMVLVVVLSGWGSRSMGHVRKPPMKGRGGVRVGVRDVREDVAIDISAGTRIRRVIMGDACVGFDLSYMGD